MEKQRVHIIKRGDGWAVKKQGNLKASKVFDTKESAKKSTHTLRDQGHDIIIHRRDGSVEKWIKGKN